MYSFVLLRIIYIISLYFIYIYIYEKERERKNVL